jgi:aryl-alcohol dehydrogenase-like predicted oxidoreductase
MATHSSRRNFLAAGLGIPAAGFAAGSGIAGARDQAPKAEYRTLGKTGLKVSSLGFGCMLASDPVVVEQAVDLGINYFDTARIYQRGNNERMVGAALKGKRDKVFLSSKSRTHTKRDALSELDTSLSELGVDYLDIWYLHVKNRPEEVTGDLLEAQQVAKKAGKIRFTGVSFHFNMPDMLAHLVKLGQTDVCLASYNFTMGPEVGEAIREARKAGMGIVAMKVMAGGYARIRRGDRLYGQDPDELTARLKRPGAMLAALKWALGNESVDTAIIGITDFDELDEDMRAMSEPFGKEDAALLAR